RNRAWVVGSTVNDQHRRGKLIDQVNWRWRSLIGETIPRHPRAQRLDLWKQQHGITPSGAESGESDTFRINVLAFTQKGNAVFNQLPYGVVGRALFKGLPSNRQNDEAFRRKLVGHSARSEERRVGKECRSR